MAERESFHDAQARHRRAGRWWLAAVALVVFPVVFLVGTLLAPPIYAALGLLLDFANLVVGAPDLLASVFRVIGTLIDDAGSPGVVVLVAALALAALPGFALLLLAWWRLGRIAGAHTHSLASALGLRAPRADDIEERQFANVVAEIAIAAGCPEPHVRVLDVDAVNLGLMGGGGDAIVFATRGALAHLTRAQTQALAAQLVASLVDGDGRLADRSVRLLELLGLIVLVSQAPLSAAARRALRPLLAMRAGDVDASTAVRNALADPLDFLSRNETALDRATDAKQGLRHWLLVPLMGSALTGVIIVPIATMFVLGPLLGLLWRRRRLLADATAVQLTRDPQALAEAYIACMGHRTTLGANAPWLANVFALDVAPAPMLRIVLPYPTWSRRIARLVAQGAIVPIPPEPPARVSWPVAVFVLGPLCAIVGGLLVLVVLLAIWLSVALNMLFLGLPVGFLHALLRGGF